MRTTAVTASLAELLKVSPEWRAFYRRCCEAGALRLRAQAWQFRDELRERGKVVALQEVEDALLLIARKVLPKTPAAQWDPEWAAELIHDALARLAEHYAELSAGEREVLDLSGQEPSEERIHGAGLNNDPAAFREALRGWEKATAEALEAARERSGVSVLRGDLFVWFLLLSAVVSGGVFVLALDNDDRPLAWSAAVVFVLISLFPVAELLVWNGP